MAYRREATALLLTVWLVTSAGAAVIKGRNGQTTNGEIRGMVLASRQGPRALAAIAGKDIESVNEKGIQLKPGATILDFGMPLTTEPAIFESTKDIDIVRAVVPLAEKVSAADSERVNAFSLVLGGEAKGPGVGLATIGKNNAYFMKRTYVKSESREMAIVGELPAPGTPADKITIKPLITLDTASGSQTLDLRTIVPLGMPTAK